MHPDTGMGTDGCRLSAALVAQVARHLLSRRFAPAIGAGASGGHPLALLGSGGMAGDRKRAQLVGGAQARAAVCRSAIGLACGATARGRPPETMQEPSSAGPRPPPQAPPPGDAFGGPAFCCFAATPRLLGGGRRAAHWSCGRAPVPWDGGTRITDAYAACPA